MREIDVMTGLSQLNAADSVAEAGAAAALVSWNENLLVADDAGHIGWWHPGRLPLRPRRWDERLPLPGTGQAEWRGVLPFRALPKVVDPPEGFIANWNNVPSAAWTNGDSPAMERNAGGLHRGAYLTEVVRRATGAPSYEAMKEIAREVGTTAQQRVLLDARLRAAQQAATGRARTLLDAIVAWDGDYDRTDGAGTVDPGVAAFEALKDAVKARELPRAAVAWLGRRGGSHPFDFGGAEAAAFRSVSERGLVAAADAAAGALAQRFGSADPAAWREPRRLYDVEVQGVAPKPRLEAYDRGTWQQVAELGP
jgi:penicillin amidase